MKRSRHEYIVDPEGLIFTSTVDASSSIFGNDVIGTYLTDYTNKDDTEPFQRKLKDCLAKGSEVCTVHVGSRLLLVVLKRITDRRIKVVRWDITGMGAEAFDLI